VPADVVPLLTTLNAHAHKSEPAVLEYAAEAVTFAPVVVFCAGAVNICPPKTLDVATPVKQSTVIIPNAVLGE
jgi:hypothetical protein